VLQAEGNQDSSCPTELEPVEGSSSVGQCY
jgi:hypothetical protein